MHDLLAGFEEKSVAIPDLRLNYVEGPANGPPLVLLHGVARDWRTFSVLLPGLSAKFQLFAVDLRGHGHSGRVPNGYTITQFGSDIAAFLKERTPAGAAVFGHSLGAMVGIQAAAQPESKVKALIIGDSMLYPEDLRKSFYYELFEQLHTLLGHSGSQQEALARGLGGIRIPVPELNEMVSIKDLPGNSFPVLMEWARAAMHTDPDVLWMALRETAFQGWNPERILPNISCPVLLLQANPDLGGLLRDSDVAMALRFLPQAEHVKFKLLGHALFLQQPKPVLDAVLDFLVRKASA